MEESAAIARVRVMAMLSTYSDLEDQLSSDDLESEVERESIKLHEEDRHQQRNIARSFFTLTGARSGSQRTVFWQIRNNLSQFVVKLQEHGRS